MTDPIRPSRPSNRAFGRRALLGGLLTLTGCASTGVGTVSGAPVTSPVTGGAPTPTVPGRPARVLIDEPARYRVLTGEVEPACKDAAVAFVTAALTHKTAATPDVPVSERLAALGQPLSAARPLLELVPPAGASAVEIVYPQYGGLGDQRDAASVMIVADQLFVSGPDDTAVRRRPLTLDVRLRRPGDRWLVEEIRPAADAIAPDRPSPQAELLLAHDGVVLPAAARADLLAGDVHDAVAAALCALAGRWRLHVQVLSRGHPEHVWGTDRVSRHTTGRAVDVWAVDGVPVVDRATCPWREFMRAASAMGASEVGGPDALGLPGHFTDHVHQDHVHLGFGQV